MARQRTSKPAATEVVADPPVIGPVIGPLPDQAPAPAHDDGLPILLGYQGRWVADKSAVKVAEKSRRIGLTWAEAFDCVTIAGADRAAGGMNCFYIGYNFEMAREFIAAAAMWAKQLQQVMSSSSGEFLFRDAADDGETREIKAFRIAFASGFSIIALPSRPRSLRGMQGVVILDEAAFHDDLPGMIKAAMALLMWGGRVRIISTHFGTANAFNELVQDCKQGRKPYRVHTITLDDALKDGLYRRICTSTGQAWSKAAETTWRDGLIANYAPNEGEELFCIPSEGGGAFFTLASLEVAASDQVPVLRLELPGAFAQKTDDERQRLTALWIDAELRTVLKGLDQDLPYAVGGDFARSGDVSSRWVYATDTTGRRRTALVLEMRNVPFTDQEQIDAALIEGLPRFQAGKYDATGNGAYLAERMQQRFGAQRIEAVKFTAAWYIENFPRLRAAIEDRTADCPRDGDIFADFRLVTLVQGTPKVPENRRTAEKGAKRGQRHGDTAIAAVLAYAASRAVTFEVGYERAVARDGDQFEPRGDYADFGDGDPDSLSASAPRTW
ncbi:MAG: hypothetical protein LCH95_13890 [Proteobacteria bacterium]|nr:hypothetical protein [Pseudomonadota bacterium]